MSRGPQDSNIFEQPHRKHHHPAPPRRPAAGPRPRRADGAGAHGAARRARAAARPAARRAAHAVIAPLRLPAARHRLGGRGAQPRAGAAVAPRRLRPGLGEELLRPGEPLFEYWGHEASWIPLELYPAFEFRRREFAHHPWWGDLVGEHPEVADDLLRRIRDEGPLRSLDMEGRGGRGWWDLKLGEAGAAALWSAGELAIRERRGFQRTYDLTERVIPGRARDGRSDARGLERAAAARRSRATAGPRPGRSPPTWRLRNRRERDRWGAARLEERARSSPCTLRRRGAAPGAPGLDPPRRPRARGAARDAPARARIGACSSRPSTRCSGTAPASQRLFGFDQVLEIFKPAAQRIYGYYCLPVLAGERLVGARRPQGRARPRAGSRWWSAHHERDDAATRTAVRTAVARYAEALGLALPRRPARAGPRRSR